MSSQLATRSYYRKTMAKKFHYRILEGMSQLEDAIAHEVTFAAEATPHDILREALQLKSEDVAAVDQVSFVPGLSAWITKSKAGHNYFIYQLSR